MTKQEIMDTLDKHRDDPNAIFYLTGGMLSVLSGGAAPPVDIDTAADQDRYDEGIAIGNAILERDSSVSTGLTPAQAAIYLSPKE